MVVSVPIRPASVTKKSVKLAMSEDRLVLSVNAPDAGAAEEELAVAYDDERLEIGFNAKYLLEIAGQVDRENAVFLFDTRDYPRFRHVLRKFYSLKTDTDMVVIGQDVDMPEPPVRDTAVAVWTLPADTAPGETEQVVQVEGLRIVYQPANLYSPWRSAKVLCQAGDPLFAGGKLVVVVVVGNGLKSIQRVTQLIGGGHSHRLSRGIV